MAETKTIKKLLIDKDLKMADIARGYGCKRQTVWKVINGIIRSRMLEAYIARRLGARVGELFPSRKAEQAA